MSGRACERILLATTLAMSLTGCGHRPANSESASTSEDKPLPALVAVGYTVQDLDRTVAFFCDVLDFEVIEQGSDREAPTAQRSIDAGRSRVARLQLGTEQIELTEHVAQGRPIPSDSTSNDLWFQHLAIVVSDMDRAYGRLVEHGVSPVSTGGPQTIPPWNRAAGGVRAYYFQDPERHVLELIWYPEGKGSARWHDDDRLFLGIDHTAIAVSSTDRSLAFYEGLLGLHKAGESLNHGPEQAALSGVQGARVRITGLVGRRGIGIELLQYLEPGPGRPAPVDTRAEDAWHWEILVDSPDPDLLVDRARMAGALWGASDSNRLRDPDQHVLRMVARRPQ